MVSGNISTLLGWYDVAKSESNQRRNNDVFFNTEIYNVEERQINVVYFNDDINNVRQCQNKVFIFNVEFHNVDQLRNEDVKEQKNVFDLQNAHGDKNIVQIIENLNYGKFI